MLRLLSIALLAPLLSLAAVQPRLLSGEPPSASEGRLSGELKVFCVSEAAPLASALAARASSSNPALKVVVKSVDSTEELFERLAAGGASCVGVVDNPSPPKGSGLQSRPFAFRGLGMAVNENNPIEGLSSAQLESVMDGSIRDWSELGGSKGRILALLSEDLKAPSFGKELLQTSFGGHSGSCGCQACKELRKEGVKAPLAPDPKGDAFRLTQERALGLVSQNVGAVALVELSNETFRGMKFLKIDGASLERESLLNGKYPLGKAFYYALPRDASASARALAEALSSPSLSDLLREKGFLPLPSAPR